MHGQSLAVLLALGDGIGGEVAHAVGLEVTAEGVEISGQ
ncbi:hypothetical protein J2Y91_003439 [Erwinia aphidicola]|nr:hypothetical protein [Erwinia aphidicola]